MYFIIRAWKTDYPGKYKTIARRYLQLHDIALRQWISVPVNILGQLITLA